MTFYIRKPDTILVTTAAGAIVIDGDRVQAISSRESERLSSLCQRMTTPMTEADALALVDADTLRLLCDLGLVTLIAREALARPSAAPTHPGVHLIVGVSGAIGAAEMVGTIRQLRQRRFSSVDVVLTECAQRFVNAAALEHYGIPVWTDPFEPRGDVRVPHIDLARRASIVLVMPASARTVHKLADGECSDLLSLVVAATAAPVVVVPAMNEQMWRNRAVARNVQRLRELGHHVVEPSLGVEVSSGLDSEPCFGGIGVAGGRVGIMLAAVLESIKGS